jgi:hypothetical protein
LLPLPEGAALPIELPLGRAPGELIGAGDFLVVVDFGFIEARGEADAIGVV